MLSPAEISAELARIDQLFSAGQRRESEAVCRRLLEAVPSCAAGWLRLGLLLLERKENSEAEAAFRQGLAYAPTAAVIWNQLGIALNRQGLAAEAEEAVRRALSLEPANPAHWTTLGTVLFDQRKLDSAAEAHRQSLAIQPHDPAVWNNLGIAEQERKQFAEAERAFLNSLALAPGHSGAISNYAFLLCACGQRDKAAQFLQPQVVPDPRVPEAWLMLGNLFEAIREWGLAADAYRRSWELAPTNEQSGYRLARMLQNNHQPAAGEDVLRAHLIRFPRHADAWALLGELLMRQGRSAEGIPLGQRAVEMSPDSQRHARLLLELQYDDHATADELLKAHRQWDTTYARPLLPVQSATPVQRAPAPLRIGIIANSFGKSPAGFLVLPGLEHLDRTKCELICYSDRTNEDEFTARFQAASTAWRVIPSLSDEQVTALVQRDRIDILIDLMGFTGQRMRVFARKPAPLQVTWLGYVGTTGMTAIDGLLADRFHVREGEEPWYSERVLRMPNDYACYGPPTIAPDVGPLPALAAGRVTFGCFNNPPKYSLRIRETWAEILRRLPTARLLLKFGGLDEPQVQSQLYYWFEKRGIARDRIAFEGWSPYSELLAAYHRVDIALDTQPYSGGLTTCEALWMGVPVITFPGATFAGRHSTSHLTNSGYGRFVANDADGYIELAVEWANRLDELSAIRSQMRDQVRQSSLCNTRQFAHDLLSLLESAFRLNPSRT
jgi:protein O-GlcNAc transferase